MESKLYHICYTSHYEVIYRTVDDANMILCRMAQMGASTGTSILAYAIMSNHVHIIVISDNIVKFVKNLRYSYTTSFNCKYHRIGRLGGRTAERQQRHPYL